MVFTTWLCATIARAGGLPTWFYAVLAGAGIPLVPYVLHSRLASGNIERSEAHDLWTQAQAMRDEYRAQITALTARVEGLEAERAALQVDVRNLEAENRTLKHKVATLERNGGNGHA